MSVGSRIQNLLDINGDSYADAEAKTGVSRETIRRICLGHQPPKLRMYIRKIAAGYNVDELSLLEGASPKGEFEWYVRQAGPAQRLWWLMMSPAERVRLTLDFLWSRYPQAVPQRTLARACGLSHGELQRIMERWETLPPECATAMIVATAINELTGISLSWFRWGGFEPRWKNGIARLRRLALLAGSTKEGLVDAAALEKLVSEVWG